MNTKFKLTIALVDKHGNVEERIEFFSNFADAMKAGKFFLGANPTGSAFIDGEKV